MNELLKIMKSCEPTDWDHLEHDLCSCSDCGWAGPVASCESYTETESWEMSHIKYTVHICPVCALHGEHGEIENFHSSLWDLFQTAYEDTKTEMGERAMKMSEYGLTSTIHKELIHQRELNAELLWVLENVLESVESGNPIREYEVKDAIAKARGEKE
jgi:hypothetical protein